MLKILLVLGSQDKIIKKITKSDIVNHKSLGVKRFFVRVKVLRNPTSDRFWQMIRNNSFDTIVIVGHSRPNTDGMDGTITINDSKDVSKNRISINEFAGPFSASVKKDLKLVILAGCSGNAAARRLVANDINVPNVIAFKLPITPNLLRRFFEELFRHWIGNSEDLETAITATRPFLNDADRINPGAATIPIILSSAKSAREAPLKFSNIIKISSWRRFLVSLPITTVISQLLDVMSSSRLSLGVLAAATCAVLITVSSIFQYVKCAMIHCPPPILVPVACDSKVKEMTYLSCGEKTILAGKYLDQNAIDGMKQLKLDTPDYKVVVEKLEKSWKNNQRNPEVLIALSNAKIKRAQQDSPEKLTVKTIAVVVPASSKFDDNEYLPISLLAAVAEAQKQWNDSRHSWLLEVMFGDDRNNSQTSKKDVYGEILARKMILGTVGPYGSYVANDIEALYKARSILINGTNTATDLGKDNLSFFKLANSNDTQAASIIQFLSREKIKKVRLLHGNKIFSTTFAENLKNRGKSKDINIVSSPFTSKTTNPYTILEASKNDGFQIIVLMPDGFVNNEDRESVHGILLANAKTGTNQIPIIGNEVVNEPWLLEAIRENPKMGQNLILSLPWNNVVDRINISQKYKLVPEWWPNRNHQISHRTVLTYDAANVLIEAIDLCIKKNMNDKEIQAQLPAIIRSNSYTGMTGIIIFKDNVRSQQLQGLVQPTFDNKGEITGFKAPEIAKDKINDKSHLQKIAH